MSATEVVFENVNASLTLTAANDKVLPGAAKSAPYHILTLLQAGVFLYGIARGRVKQHQLRIVHAHKNTVAVVAEVQTCQ